MYNTSIAIKKPTDTVYVGQRHTDTEVPCAYACIILVYALVTQCTRICMCIRNLIEDFLFCVSELTFVSFMNCVKQDHPSINAQAKKKVPFFKVASGVAKLIKEHFVEAVGSLP